MLTPINIKNNLEEWEIKIWKYNIALMHQLQETWLLYWSILSLMSLSNRKIIGLREIFRFYLHYLGLKWLICSKRWNIYKLNSIQKFINQVYNFKNYCPRMRENKRLISWSWWLLLTAVSTLKYTYEQNFGFYYHTCGGGGPCWFPPCCPCPGCWPP